MQVSPDPRATQSPPPERDRCASFQKLLKVQPGSTIALMGAGGKHTLMARLDEELTALGLAVLLTSSTQLHRPTGQREPSLILLDEQTQWRQALRSQLHPGRSVYVLQHDLGRGMLKGLSMERLQELRQDFPKCVMVVKADGARKRSLKAPGLHEPMIPPFADIGVVIVGMDCIGQPLQEAQVHRPEVVSALCGVPEGTRITAQLVARVIAHPDSYPSRIPAACRSVLYLSKTRTDQDRKNAREIFRQISPGTFSMLVAGDTPTGRVEVFADCRGSSARA